MNEPENVGCGARLSLDNGRVDARVDIEQDPGDKRGGRIGVRQTRLEVIQRLNPAVDSKFEFSSRETGDRFALFIEGREVDAFDGWFRGGSIVRLTQNRFPARSKKQNRESQSSSGEAIGLNADGFDRAPC